MGKINNIVRVVQFEKDTDLYFNIDRLMSSDGERWKVSKPYRVKNINLIDNSHALVYLEEDLSVVQVHFFYDGVEIIPEDEPHSEEYLSYDEVNLINELGSVTIEDKEYDVEEIKFSINSYGTRCVNIYLN